MLGERAAGEQEAGGLRVRLPRDPMRCGSRSILPKPSASSEETATRPLRPRAPAAVASQAHRLFSAASDGGRPWDAVRRCGRETAPTAERQAARTRRPWIMLYFLKVTWGRTPGARTCLLGGAEEAWEGSVICGRRACRQRQLHVFKRGGTRGSRVNTEGKRQGGGDLTAEAPRPAERCPSAPERGKRGPRRRPLPGKSRGLRAGTRSTGKVGSTSFWGPATPTPWRSVNL